MKKFTIVSLITSGVMLFLGIIMVIIGVTAGESGLSEVLSLMRQELFLII